MSDALGQPSILPSEWPSAAYKVGYERGVADEKARIRTGVTGLADTGASRVSVALNEVLAVIVGRA